MGKRARSQEEMHIVKRDSSKDEQVLPRWITPELIDETLRVFNPWYRGRLAREDAVEILRNTGRLLDVA